MGYQVEVVIVVKDEAGREMERIVTSENGDRFISLDRARRVLEAQRHYGDYYLRHAIRLLR